VTEGISPGEITWNNDRHLHRIEFNRTESLTLALFMIEYEPLRAF
jgi:hypothetical protein